MADLSTDELAALIDDDPSGALGLSTWDTTDGGSDGSGDVSADGSSSFGDALGKGLSSFFSSAGSGVGSLFKGWSTNGIKLNTTSTVDGGKQLIKIVEAVLVVVVGIFLVSFAVKRKR